MTLRHAVVLALLSLTPLPLRADRAEPGSRELKEAPGRAVAPRPPVDSEELLQPALVVPAPSLLLVVPGDLRIAPREGGFVALVPGAGGPSFTAFREDGTIEASLFSPGHAVERWWLSPDGKRVAWVSGGTLYTATAGAKAMDSLGAAPIEDLAFTRDGAHLVFVRDGVAVIRTVADRTERTVRAEPGLLLGGAAVLSADGKTLFALAGPDTPVPDGLARAGAPAADGLASADLTAAEPVLKRCFQASGSTLRTLTLSPDGLSLAFIQAAGKPPEALRLFTPASGDVRTLARAPMIEHPVFTADGSRIAFSGRAANGRMQAWSAATVPDVTKGVYVTRQLAELEGREILHPAPAAGGGFWLLVKDADGKAMRVGRVK